MDDELSKKPRKRKEGYFLLSLPIVIPLVAAYFYFIGSLSFYGWLTAIHAFTDWSFFSLNWQLGLLYGFFIVLNTIKHFLPLLLLIVALLFIFPMLELLLLVLFRLGAKYHFWSKKYVSFIRAMMQKTFSLILTTKSHRVAHKTFPHFITVFVFVFFIIGSIFFANHYGQRAAKRNIISWQSQIAACKAAKASGHPVLQEETVTLYHDQQINDCVVHVITSNQGSLFFDGQRFYLLRNTDWQEISWTYYDREKDLFSDQ